MTLFASSGCPLQGVTPTRSPSQCQPSRGQNSDEHAGDPSAEGSSLLGHDERPRQPHLSNPELVSVRDAMRQLPRLLAALGDGELEKIVLTQRNQMRAVVVSVERYSQLQRDAA